MPVVGNTADTPNSPGLLPFLKEIWESPRTKENLAPVGFEPTTSGTDLPVLYRLSYKASTRAGRGNLDSKFAVKHVCREINQNCKSKRCLPLLCLNEGPGRWTTIYVSITKNSPFNDFFPILHYGKIRRGCG